MSSAFKLLFSIILLLLSGPGIGVQLQSEQVVRIESVLTADGLDASLNVMRGLDAESLAVAERGILTLTDRLLAEDKIVAAVEILKLYVELVPESERPYRALSSACNRYGDREAAARYNGIFMAKRSDSAFERIIAGQSEPLATTADEVISGAIKAMGGREAVAALPSTRMTMTGYQMAGGFGGSRLLQPPNLVRQEFDNGGAIVSNGKRVWSIRSGGWTEIDNAMWLKVHSISLDLLDYEAKGVTYDFVGLEGLEGAALYKLGKMHSNGDRHFVYFNVETGLLVMEEDFLNGGDSANLYFDYREFEGVLLPHMRVRIGSIIKTPHIALVNYDALKTVDPALFEIP
ncbi:MAG: hypothetical protein GY835_00705 [bacterium]|nr:hypothetical protein [bacterium]